MDPTILCQSAGWILFSDGSRLVFADRGTSYLHVLFFVLALVAFIAAVNGLVWLGIGIASGEASRLGMALAAVGVVLALGAWQVWKAEKREQETIPEEHAWVVVLDLENQRLETPTGETLAPLSSVRFVPVLQLGSSSRALAAKWAGESLVVYRGSPFAGSFRAAAKALRRHGVDAG